MGETWIYRYEVKSIQSFILASDKLKEIKGASSLIVEIGDLFSETRKTFGLDSAAGVLDLAAAEAGGATIEVPSSREEALDAFMAVWPLLVERHSPGVQLVQARSRGPSVRSEAWEELYAGLRAARSRQPAELPEAGPQLLRAPRTGLPAVSLDSGVAVDAAGRRKLAVAAKDELGRKINREWRWVEDLDRLQHSYVGVVHLDGNDLGIRVKQIIESSGPDRLLEFSNRLAEGTLDAVRSTVESVLVPAKREAEGRLPGRPIVVGGDDVTFIVRGDVALPFAQRLLLEFEQKNHTATGGPLYATAGVALARRHHPFRAAHDLAEGLCKFAKSRLRGSGAGGSTPSSLAYYRLTSSSSGTWSEIRQRELAGRPPFSSTNGDVRGYLSLCPYLVDATSDGPTLDQLEHLVAAVSRLPSKPLRDWLDLLRRDSNRAGPHYQRFREVQIRQARGERIGELEKALAQLGAANGWREVASRTRGEEYGSPLLDALTWIRMQEAA